MIKPNVIKNNKYGNIFNIIYLVVFISFNILEINGIYKKTITKLQTGNNKKNVMKFWIDVFKELIFVPFFIYVQWLFFILIMVLLTIFIKIITNPENSGTIKNSNINYKFLIHILIVSLYIYTVLFLINFIIIIIFLIILLFNVNNTIDNHYINRIFRLYQVIVIISIIYLFNSLLLNK